MSFSLIPSKRPHDRSPVELNGKGKWQKSAGFHSQLQPLKISPGSTYFRVLCPVSKSGSVIGKGGSIISNIRQETGAKVRVEEPVSGDDERVIVIVGPDTDKAVENDEKKEEGSDNNVLSESMEVNENDERNEDKVSSPVEDSQSEKGTSTVQKALFLVFERMVEGERENDDGDEESNKSSSFVVRLLVLSSQVGCLLGKGGSVIKQMAAESGAQIRILPRDKLPQCASPSDELVQLTGGIEAVRKALQSVSQQLLENPPRDRDTFPASKPMGSSSHPLGTFSKPQVYPSSNYQFPSQGAAYGAGSHDRADFPLNVPPSIPKYRESVIPSRARPFDMTFRLVCHNEKVGGIIGKGGTIVKTIHKETGCDIRILEGVPETEDRIVAISGSAHPDDTISAVQDAVLRVQGRIVRGVPDSNEKNVVAKLLVSSSQIGCLLGKGGTIIAEMRKLSGAHIRIVPRDQLPKCASENEEVVQINGEFESVQEALLQITARLRHLQFRDAFPSINHPLRPNFPDQAHPFPFMGRRELSPPGMYSDLGQSFHQFDAVGGLPPHGHIHPIDDRPGFMHSVHRPGIPHGSGRIPSSAPWETQGMPDGGGLMGISEYGSVPQRRAGGFGSGTQPAIITSTIVEVVVPRAIVPSIYGEDGGSLKQIRQISGAKVTITEPRPGATETVVIISGTPEQTHAAQSLLQAFVLSGTDSP